MRAQTAPCDVHASAITVTVSPTPTVPFAKRRGGSSVLGSAAMSVFTEPSASVERTSNVPTKPGDTSSSNSVAR